MLLSVCGLNLCHCRRRAEQADVKDGVKCTISLESLPCLKKPKSSPLNFVGPYLIPIEFWIEELNWRMTRFLCRDSNDKLFYALNSNEYSDSFVPDLYVPKTKHFFFSPSADYNFAGACILLLWAGSSCLGFVLWRTCQLNSERKSGFADSGRIQSSGLIPFPLLYCITIANF